jgi:hypothetical protein
MSFTHYSTNTTNGWGAIDADNNGWETTTSNLTKANNDKYCVHAHPYTYSTSTLETDPWANQRLFNYDNTLRTACSPNEKKEAEETIDSITNAQGLVYYEQNIWRMIPGNRNPKNVEFYAKKFDDRRANQDLFETRNQQIKDIYEEIAVLWKREQDYREEANNARNAIEATDLLFNLDVANVKKAFKDDQISLKKLDEARKIKMLAEAAPSGNPLEEKQHSNPPNIAPTLNNRESRIWKLRICYKCGEIGHGRKHHTIAKKEFGIPTKPWGSWKSESPSHNRYLLLRIYNDY